VNRGSASPYSAQPIFRRIGENSAFRSGTRLPTPVIVKVHMYKEAELSKLAL
jgi:hypothetical protein